MTTPNSGAMGPGDGEEPPSEGARDPIVGSRIGSWEVLGVLGTGGMGSVYHARRVDDFEQEVALKLVHRVDPDHHGRIIEERRILAGLEHPGIARLVDGGTLDDGRPWFAMELVRGGTIDEHLASNATRLRERVALFVDVCDAVAYAHQNLVIHRDIKPSNILVDDRGIARLVDFGIAGLLPETPDDSITATGAMTPSYASPEQLTGDRLTAASDIFSLGLLLCELLTGSRPFARQHQVLAKAATATAPSVLLRREAAADWPVDAGRLAGDLDAIVLRCLRREPEQRYPTVEALAADLRRYLAGEPVQARRGDWRYRAGKFIVRHAAAVVLATLFVATLAGSLVNAVLLQRETARQRDEAREQRATAEQVTRFFAEMFGEATTDRALGQTVTVVEAMQRALPRVEQELGDRPGVQARLWTAAGSVYTNLAHHEEAAALLERALETLADPDVGDPESEAAARDAYARYLLITETPDAAYEESKRALELLASLPAPDPALQSRVEMSAGIHAYRAGFAEEGLQLVRTAAEHAREAAPEEDAHLGYVIHVEGVILGQAGRYEEAIERIEEGLAILERFGDSPRLAIVLRNLALPLNRLKRYDEAVELVRRALSIQEAMLPAASDALASTRVGLAFTLLELGKLEESEKLLLENIAATTETYGRQHRRNGDSLHTLGDVYFDRSKAEGNDPEWLQKAIDTYAEAAAIRAEIDRSRLSSTERWLAQAYAAQGDHEEAVRWARKAVATEQEVRPEGRPDLWSALFVLATVTEDAGMLTEAEATFRDRLELADRLWPGDTSQRFVSNVHVARFLVRHDRAAEAVPIFETALAVGEAVHGPDHEWIKGVREMYEEALGQP